MITSTQNHDNLLDENRLVENQFETQMKCLETGGCNQVSSLVDQSEETTKSDNPTETIASPECNRSKSSQNDNKKLSADPAFPKSKSNIDDSNNDLITSTSNATINTSQSISQEETIEHQLLKARRNLESMVLKYAKSERENLQNKHKADELDKKLKRTIKDNDQLSNRIKLLTNDKNHLTDTLNAKLAQLTVLEQKNSYLNNVEGVKLKEYEETIKRLEVTNEKLSTLIDSYKSKEGELLDFSERLSMKHMMLQAELDEALKMVPNHKDQYEECLKECSELIREKEEIDKRLEFVGNKLKLEQEHSERLKLERDENELSYRNNLEQLQNEIKVLRRKHQMASKELVKEIRYLMARSEKFDPTLNSNKGGEEDRSIALMMSLPGEVELKMLQ